MSDAGHRHRLLVYTYLLDRCWRKVLAIGMVLLVLTGGLLFLPGQLPGIVSYNMPETSLWAAGGGGLFAVFTAVFLFAIRKSAYVQPFDNHLRLTTPFLKLRIAYRRIRQSGSMEMECLYPKSMLKKKRRLLKSLTKYPFIVLDLNGLPLPRWALLLFLSPLFFPDKTARLALLVPDWIKFSTEMESFRSAWMDTQRQPGTDPRMSLLSDIRNRVG